MYSKEGDLIFTPGSVVPTSDWSAFTFTVIDQFDRTWNAADNLSSFRWDHQYKTAASAKEAMRKFCGIEIA